MFKTTFCMPTMMNFPEYFPSNLAKQSKILFIHQILGSLHPFGIKDYSLGLDKVCCYGDMPLKSFCATSDVTLDFTFRKI